MGDILYKVILENDSKRGRLFTTIMDFIGMGMVTIPTGLLSSTFSKTYKKDK